ncbi:MAG: STAS domain-containing protein [Ignavibacteriales bacterium]|nr:MAG: STAS domain-containing protein [Ignavibacteriaceae bacterium]MBW7871819.1 STAS domain-containing protein [Ignavibacteria bacterium]MCZ2144331.1 STAS domain-containing protein [Ignavibacteriales bacterium]OQY76402.1 MAG: hypothetical protein B6D45_03580 [Ignavibacteriales bacterium UTCHB3]MBV6446284.1 putative anti-sigma factor antagonist BtrV [Ignavibacteriaceae bacterium]
MDIKVKKEAGFTILNLNGRCEIKDYDELNSHLNEIVGSGERRLILDFTSLNFINSAGLRAIILTIQKMKAAEGKIVFCNVNETIEKLFAITGYSSILERYNSLSEAKASFGGDA